jgi:alpha-tubulin suppressor-like RCC1 family protein
MRTTIHQPLQLYTDPCSRRPSLKTLSVIEAACGVTLEGELYCWGGNSRGQLGIGRPGVESTHIPRRVLDPL